MDAVAEARRNAELLAGSGFEDDTLGQHLDPFDARVVRLRSGRSGRNPFGQDAIFQGADLQPFAAFVRNRGGGFEEEEAAARISGNDPASQGIACQGEIITAVVVAAQGEFKTIFALG